MGYSLDDEYSVTRVVAKAAWYSPCVICSMFGASTRSVSGIIGWVVGWGCGRGFSWCVFVKCVLLGYFVGTFLGRVNRSELGRSDGFFLGKF